MPEGKVKKTAVSGLCLDGVGTISFALMELEVPVPAPSLVLLLLGRQGCCVFRELDRLQEC